MEENDIVYIIPTALDKPIKVTFENKPICSEMDYNKCLEGLKEKYDVIFIDPPYKQDIAVKAIEKIINLKILSKDGIIIHLVSTSDLSVAIP